MSEEIIPENSGENQEIIRDDKGRFVPGISGNPKGKPEGTRSFTTIVKEVMEKLADIKDEKTGEKMTYEEALAKSILLRALQGSEKMVKLLWNYRDGMPPQSILHKFSQIDEEWEKNMSSWREKINKDDDEERSIQTGDQKLLS